MARYEVQFRNRHTDDRWYKSSFSPWDLHSVLQGMQVVRDARRSHPHNEYQLVEKLPEFDVPVKEEEEPSYVRRANLEVNYENFPRLELEDTLRAWFPFMLRKGSEYDTRLRRIIDRLCTSQYNNGVEHGSKDTKKLRALRKDLRALLDETNTEQ